MDKKFGPEKYGLMICPACEEYGRICYPDDTKVCQNCGGFGFIRKDGKLLVKKTNQFETPLQAES
jgi:hypothetical protein